MTKAWSGDVSGDVTLYLPQVRAPIKHHSSPPHSISLSLSLSSSFTPLCVRQSDVTVESRQCRVTLVIWDGGRKHPGQRVSQ